MDMNKLVKSNYKTLNSIDRSNSDGTYTVLASLNDYFTHELLALSTGTQANLREHPDDLEDCHAEVLVRRALKRRLLAELSKSDNLTTVTRYVTLFVSQFPCGLIRRFEGHEPIDSSTGLAIKRKPGRGTVLDGRVVYVEQDDCWTKLQRWVKDGFEGKLLRETFGLRCTLRRIVIGKCEPGDDVDYKSYVRQMNRTLGPEVEVLAIDWREREFVYNTEKSPKSVIVTLWKQPAGYDCDMQVEYIVKGRRRGLARKHIAQPQARLAIANSCIREEVARLVNYPSGSGS